MPGAEAAVTGRPAGGRPGAFTPADSGPAELSPEARAVSWRVLKTPPAPGPWNMAVDEAIAEACAAGLVPPTLRVYGWSPPALSLGYFQALADVDEAACRSAGVDIVRRLTGGRAILHDKELTYSVVLPERWLPGSVTAAYRTLAGALVRGLRLLGPGISLEPERRGREAAASAACFDRPASYEVTAQGRKLAGSAQTRRHGCILQHGSIPLTFDPAAIFRLLRLTAAEQARQAAHLARQAISLTEALGREPAWAEAATAVIAGWGQEFGLTMQEGTLTDAEQQRAAELVRTKYGDRAWTARH